MPRAVTIVRYRARISSGSAVLVASIALVLTVILPAFPRMSPLTFLACFEVGTICLIFEIIIVSCMGKSNVCDMVRHVIMQQVWFMSNAKREAERWAM